MGCGEEPRSAATPGNKRSLGSYAQKREVMCPARQLRSETKRSLGSYIRRSSPCGYPGVHLLIGSKEGKEACF